MRRCSCAACVMFGTILSISILLSCLLLSTSPRGTLSFAAVDPSVLLSSRVLQRLLPSYLEEDLNILRSVCSANETRFDILGRELLVRNFTIRQDKGRDVDTASTSPPAFRVGYLNITWDSYLRPCLNFELGDVDVAVEFTNVLLTNTNWQELYRQKGFPPPLITGYYEDDEPAETEEESSTNIPGPEKDGDSKSASDADKYLDFLIEEGGLEVSADADGDDVGTSASFIRIGRVFISGNMTLHTISRPLGGKDIAQPFHFDLKALTELATQLERAADEEKTGSRQRKGCTVERAYDIVTTYFLRKLEQILAKTVFDISIFGKESAPMQKANSLLSSAESLAKNYASSMKKLAEENAKGRLGGIQQKILDKLQAMGVDDDKVEGIRKSSNTLAEKTVGLVGAVLKEKLVKVQTDRQQKRNGGPDDEL